MPVIVIKRPPSICTIPPVSVGHRFRVSNGVATVLLHTRPPLRQNEKTKFCLSRYSECLPYRFVDRGALLSELEFIK